MYKDKPPIDSLCHYGTPRHSGRYPWGSGDEPYQHAGDFLSRVEELRRSGKTEKEIAEEMGISTTALRAQKAIAKEERRSEEVETAKKLRDKGYSLNKIAEKMGYSNDSSIRSLLNEKTEARMNVARSTADFLQDQIDKYGMVDVGKGVERNIGVSSEKLNEALYMLQMRGYPVYGGGVPQATNPGRQTILKVACPPGTEHKDIYDYNIHMIGDYKSQDSGETFDPKWVYPKSMDSKRLKIRYAEDGGVDKDGLIELRRGVDDISLGNSQYAQVRILVDGTHYLKGMAVYSDNMPDGVDIVFNTNKTKDTPALGPKNNTVLKPIHTDDPKDPFGSLIKAGIEDPDVPGSEGGQRYYYDKNGKKQLSLINKRAEEGDWGEWSHSLPSQFLSKQNEQLIKKQLGLAIADKEQEYDDICSVTNPTVKKVLLKTFANDCDSSAVHLKAAALPRQRYQVILPVPSLSENEIYAPNYRDGEQVALIRFPHGGTFEIPILKVNNKQADAKKMIGSTPQDAVGINKKVADRLSGADFDGDTVMVIPCGGKTKITSTHKLKGLEGFDPKMEYGGKPDGSFKKMKNTQTEMGKISNLITDMTLKGASEDELARAVRHSMVVIDAEKHSLDYKQSEADNGIAALKKKYQGRYDEEGKYHDGASTLISRAKSKAVVTKRKGSPQIDKDTGEVSYKEVHETYINKNGKLVERTQNSTAMAETKDARTLSSGTRQEELYADYANRMKAMANRARKEMMSIGRISFSTTASRTYENEVKTLTSKLNVALMNAPKERQAQIMAKSKVNSIKESNPDMTKSEIKKANQRALSEARAKIGAKRQNIPITDREWEAIQAGAISENKLYQIIDNTSIDDLRERATPRTKNVPSTAKINKMKAMSESGYSAAEIADAVGCSTSTVHKYLNEKGVKENE